MSLYLKTKKLDIETGDPLVVMLNEKDAQLYGVSQGQKVMLAWQDLELFVVINLTGTEVQSGEVGVYTELWEQYDIPNDEVVSIDIVQRPQSIDFIKKKLLGEKLNKEEILEIMRDISTRRIREVESAYFMACFFNPGFDDEEVSNIAVGMAEAGDVLDFRNIKKNGDIVVDKHSIGGISGKGVTPIIVPIIASTGLIIPNTSTRAITTPAGTTDILEVVMPVALSTEIVKQVVSKAGGCMIWGGSLKLAPADDVLISVEKDLRIQSQNKLIASIVAKKVSMGITHVLIDIPYGPDAKIKSADEAELLSKAFVKQFAKLNIKCETIDRFVLGPDGNGIGPALEVRDILYILERREERPKALEKVALEMAGQLIELAGKAPYGKGLALAKKILEDGKALNKFWEIAVAQGAQKKYKADEIKLGLVKKEIYANKTGKLKLIDNSEVVTICRSLGTPFIKDAGLYFHKAIGDVVKKGDLLVTVYANSEDRMRNGLQVLNLEKLFTFR